LLTIEKFWTLKTRAFFTGLTAIILILLRILVLDDQPIDLLGSTAIVYTLTVLLVPNGLHLLLCQQLEAKLFWRLGEIWGEGKGPRSLDLIRAKSEYTEELDLIEQKFGEQLTETELSYLVASRRQYEIGKKWPLPVLSIWALTILLAVS
jgi:hypothetical protein